MTTATTEGPVLPLVPSQEEQMLRESVRGITSKYGPDFFLARQKNPDLPNELWTELGENGFLGVNVPEEFGGGGLGVRELAIVQEETAAAGCPQLLMVVSNGMAAPIVTKYGTQEQREDWLPGIADGSGTIVFAITEPDAGSNSHNVATVAKPVDGGYRISGQKTYISGVEVARGILMVCRTGTDEKGRAQLSLFIVDAETEGLECQQIPTVLGAGDDQWSLYLEDVFVSEDRLIGPLNGGLKVVFDALNPERIMAAAQGIGLGRYALEKAAKYANERAVWGVPVGAHQGVAHPLAEAYADLKLASYALERAGALYDAGAAEAGEAANIAKLAAAEAGIKCIDRAIAAHGGNGFSEEYKLPQYYFIARSLRGIPVSREMILNFIAQHSLGLPRSY